MRRVDRCEVRREGDLVIMNIEANAFLLHMVKYCISAASCWAGADNDYVRELLLLKDRQQLGMTGPAQGLYLAEVSYPSYDFPVPQGFLSLGIGETLQVCQAFGLAAPTSVLCEAGKRIEFYLSRRFKTVRRLYR